MSTPTRRTRFTGVLLLALCATGINAFSQGAADSASEIDRLVTTMYPSLDVIYKDLHSHPELAFEEVRTAAKLAAEMRALGFEVTEKVAKTGIVAIFRNGVGPTVMVRTELDALPMEEKTGLPYASTLKTSSNGRDTFVAHSCGHDIHMTSWLGTARTLVAMKSRWQGTLMFVGQPAEETVSGAKAMLDDGLFKRFPKPDFALAFHVTPAPYGGVASNVGPRSTNSDGVEIVFKGRGGHGSAPHNTIDPIMMAAHFVTNVQTVVSLEKDPAEFGVVTFGSFQAGTVGNIIPDTATLRGTIRSFSPAARAKLLAGVKRSADAAAAMAGAASPDVTLIDGGLAVMNSEAVVTRVEKAFAEAFGAKFYLRTPPMGASEDFSAFVNEGVPSMYFSVGGSDPQLVAAARLPGGKPVPYNHSPFFAPVPEPSIKTGIRATSLATLTLLKPQ